MSTVLIAGAGLAGLCAAVLLAREGHAVTVLEQRTILGGRTHALVDGATGATIDNGQHVMLAGYRRTREYLRIIGTEHLVRFEPATATVFRDSAHGPVWLRAPALPAPLDRAGALFAMLRLANVPLRARVPSVALVREFAGMVARRGVPRALDEISADTWLRRMRVAPAMRRAFWDPFTVSTLNEKPERVSAFLLATVLYWGFLSDPANGRLGYPTVDLDALFVAPAVAYLSARGARILPGAGAHALHLERGQIAGITAADGVVHTADAYIAALPAAPLTRLLRGSPLADDPFFARAARIESAPIVAVNYWLDGPLHTEHPYEALLDCAIEWVFDRGRMHGRATGPGHYYTLIVSASWQLEGATQAQVLEAAAASLAMHYPEFARRAVLRASVVRHPNATFSAPPGFEALRCTQRTPVPNLFLAGDWTDTALPSTMESATESAFRAVAAARARLTA